MRYASTSHVQGSCQPNPTGQQFLHHALLDAVGFVAAGFHTPVLLPDLDNAARKSLLNKPSSKLVNRIAGAIGDSGELLKQVCHPVLVFYVHVMVHQ